MKKAKLTARHPALIILLVGLAVSIMLAISKPEKQAGPPVMAPLPELAARVATPRAEIINISSQGSVNARTRVQLVAQVSGLVENVSDNFVAGGYFKSGEVLLQIDPRDYRIALAQARSALATARQALAEEKGKALQAKREWRDLGDKEANELFLRKPQQAAAEASVEAAQANLEKAELDLERTQIKLPYKGRVLSTQTHLGQYLGPGSSIAEVYATDLLEVRLPLLPQQVDLLGLLEHQEAPRLPVSLFSTFGTNTVKWTGQLTRLEAGVDPQTRLFYAVVELKPEQTGVRGVEARPGMFVDAVIASEPVEGVEVLPRSALVNNNQLLTVIDTEVKAIEVEVLQIDDREVRVRYLPAGELVLLAPPGYLSSGMHVKAIIEPQQDDAEAVSAR